MYLSGLLPRPMSADDDGKLLQLGIGFTNIVERTTRGSANLTRKEIEDGKRVEQITYVISDNLAKFNGSACTP